MDLSDPYARPPSDPYAFPVAERDASHFDRRAVPDPTTDDAATAADEPLELHEGMLATPAHKGLDFERGMDRFPPLTIGLIVFLAVIFGWEVWSGALANEEALLKAGALQRVAVVRGECWRILTGMMLHGSSDHLLGNCIGLFMLGLVVEHAYNRRLAAAIYISAGVVAALFCLTFEGATTVGASGAIFGWWGAAVVFYFKHRARLLQRDGRVGTVLLGWAAWSVFTGLCSPQVSNFSHIGGFLCGAVLAALLPTRLIALHEPEADGQNPLDG